LTTGNGQLTTDKKQGGKARTSVRQIGVKSGLMGSSFRER
jgi:hypothetical protein